MSNYRISVDEIKAAARGREVEILEHVAGISPDVLDGDGHPCPLCRGTDRFSLVDRDAGAVLCRRCFDKKNGDFLAAIAWARNVTFSQACKLAGVYLSVGTNAKPATDLCKSKQAKLKTYPTAAAAVAALEQKLGPRSASWTYHNLAGEPVGLIVRWNRPDGGKDIRPVSKHADGWQIGGMPEPRPLYRLSTLPGAETVLVCEGEKTTDAAVSLGFVATTSPHGSQSAAKADWSPLAGEWVVIVPDCDDPGEMYAAEVAEILTKLSPPARVSVVSLPGLNEGDDLVEWIAAGGTRDELQALIDDAPEWKPAAEPGPGEVPPPKEPPAQAFKPFPVGSLPEVVRQFVAAMAGAIQCDISFVILPLLAAMASAIGNTRRARLDSEWCEPCILWCVSVGDSGTQKSPSLSAATNCLDRVQNQLLRDYYRDLDLFETEKKQYEDTLAAWKKAKGIRGERPQEPQGPPIPSLIICDVTMEGVASRLEENPRGTLLARDELSGWLRSFDAYRGGKGGGDVAHWLSVYGGRPLRQDRKGTNGGKKLTYIPRASVSITGTIQPEVLGRSLRGENWENGLAPRLMMTFPPKRQRRWKRSNVNQGVKQAMADVFNRLLAFDFRTDEDGDIAPIDLPLTLEAELLWADFFDTLNDEQQQTTGRESALLSKIEGVCPRIALVLQCVRAASDEADPNVIDEISMTSAITIANWLGREARRIYAVLLETNEQREDRKLVELIQRRGGTVTPRDLQRSSNQWRQKTAEEAEQAIEALVKSGWGQWEQVTHNSAGRPTRVFRLRPSIVIDTIPGNSGETPILSIVNCIDEGKLTLDGRGAVAVSEGVIPENDDDEVVEWTA